MLGHLCERRMFLRLRVLCTVNWLIAGTSLGSKTPHDRRIGGAFGRGLLVRTLFGVWLYSMSGNSILHFSMSGRMGASTWCAIAVCVCVSLWCCCG